MRRPEPLRLHGGRPGGACLGKRLLFEAWPDFTMDGKPPAYSGRILVVFTVEYGVRTGYFAAEKRGIKVELPVKFELRCTGSI